VPEEFNAVFDKLTLKCVLVTVTTEYFQVASGIFYLNSDERLGT
jgi:hypothetical protein